MDAGKKRTKNRTCELQTLDARDEVAVQFIAQSRSPSDHLDPWLRFIPVGPGNFAIRVVLACRCGQCSRCAAISSTPRPRGRSPQRLRAPDPLRGSWRPQPSGRAAGDLGRRLSACDRHRRGRASLPLADQGHARPGTPASAPAAFGLLSGGLPPPGPGLSSLDVGRDAAKSCRHLAIDFAACREMIFGVSDGIRTRMLAGSGFQDRCVYQFRH